MTLDYSKKGQVSIDMTKYVDTICNMFPQEYIQDAIKFTSPWNDNLFKVNKKSKLLSNKMKEQFHTTTAQGLFLCKRARPDISPAIAYLTTRVNNPTEDDWSKLVRMIKYLKQTSKDILTLKADDLANLHWHVNSLCSASQL